MDRLNSMLNRQTKRAYQHPIQLAMKLAARKLDRYYSKTDDSAVYRIAMSAYLLCQSFLLCFNILSVLHPGLKLEYFRKHDWQEEWVDVAENLVREEYISNYENKMGEPELTRSVDASDKAIVGLLLTFFRLPDTQRMVGPLRHGLHQLCEFLHRHEDPCCRQ